MQKHSQYRKYRGNVIRRPTQMNTTMVHPIWTP